MKLLRIFTNLPIRWKLLCGYAGVILVGILIMATVEYVSASHTITDSFRNVIRNDVEQKALDISNRFQAFERISATLTADTEILEYLAQSNETPMDIFDLQLKLAPRLQSIYMTNPELYALTFYISNPSFKGLGGPIRYIDDEQDQPWYNELQRSSSSILFWSGTTKDPNGITKDPQPVVSIIRPLYNRDTMKQTGLIKLDFRESLVFQVMDKNLFQDAYTWIEDEKGKMVYTVDEKKFPILLLDRERENVLPDIPSLVSQESMGYLFCTQSVSGSGWRLVAAVPLYHLRLQVAPTIMNIVKVSAICLLFLALISFGIANLISRRLGRIAKQAHHISEGDLKVRLKDRHSDEIGQLSMAINHMSDRLEQLIEDNNQSHISQRKAELSALQAQINPHFLYNTLSLVSYLADDIEAYQISNVAKTLIRFFRLSLNSGSHTIKVRHEIEQVRAYLDIQLLHYSGHFTYRIEVEPEILDLEMMKLILQPFVENSIIHGLKGMSSPIEIVIRARQEGQCILFSIEDSGCGVPPSVQQQFAEPDQVVTSKGYGISNVQARIRLRYGKQYGVRLYGREQGGTRVDIEIPAAAEQI